MYERESKRGKKILIILQRAYLMVRIRSKMLAELSFSSLVTETSTTVSDRRLLKRGRTNVRSNEVLVLSRNYCA